MSHLTLQIMGLVDRITKHEKRIADLEDLAKPKHGNSMYTKGCRCDVCKEARKIDMRKRRARDSGRMKLPKY